MRYRIPCIAICAICLTTFEAYSQARNEAFLPHIANGSFAVGSFRTTFILFNNTDSKCTALVRLTGDDGRALVVTIPGLGTGGEFQMDLPAGGTKIIQTDGSGSLVGGAATVISDAIIGLSAIFSVYDTSGNFLTEAGIGDSLAVSDFVIPVDVTGDFNTGLALFNPASMETTVDIALRDTAGQEIGKSSLKISPGGHLARFVAGPGQLFPSTTAFRGTLAIKSNNAISALTLRQNSAPLSYTSLPVVHPLAVQSELFLPHVANGSYGEGRFKTSFLFLNLHPMTANVRLSLTKSDGTPFPVTLLGKGTESNFDFKLEPNASVFLQTDGSGSLAVGAAAISSDVPIGASGIFSVFNAQGGFQTEAGVGATNAPYGFTLPVDITGKFDTGVAFFNPRSSPAEVTLRLMAEDGEVRGVRTKFTLPAKNQTARFVSQLFPGTTSFRGSLAVSDAGIASITLRQNSSPLSYTTLPVKQGVSSGKMLPLLTQTTSGISATNDIVVNETLATGFRLTGSINGAAYPGLVGALSSTGEITVGRLGSSSSRNQYLIVLPVGTYTLKVCYQPQEGYANITYTDPNPVRILADTARDINVTPPSLIGISGMVSGLSNLPQVQAKSIVFNSLDNSVWVQLSIDDNGKYIGRIPPGNFRANLYLPNAQLPNGRTELLTVFNFGTVIVGSTPVVANFTVPPLAKLSGTLSAAGAGGVGIQATDRSAPASPVDSCGYFPASSSADTDPVGQYQMMLLKDRSYDVQARLPVVRSQGFAGTIFYPTPGALINLAADGKYDISIPVLPEAVVISGKVTDGTGRGVGNVQVGAWSQSITGAPNAGLSNLGVTDANGDYRIVVLSGTNYRLTFTPPVPLS